MKRVFCLAWFASVCLLSCTVSSEKIEENLNKIAQSDLSDIIEDVKKRGPDSLLAEDPNYRIEEFKIFKGDTGRVYKAYACVHYYYLKSLKLYQIRKYRYNTAANFWDRYDIKLKHLSNGKSLEKAHKKP